MKMRIPTNNEYDRLVDLTDGANDKMHRKDMLSWVNDAGAEHCVHSDCRTVRGWLSARYWRYGTASSRDVVVGFRPAVEALGSGALAPDVHNTDPIIIGTLYMDDKPVVIPQNPTWDGDVTAYIPGAKLEMREALDNPQYQVTGFRVGDAFIADRVLLNMISATEIERICETAKEEEKALNGANEESPRDDLVSVTLTKSEWGYVLDGLRLAIDDRWEMSKKLSEMAQDEEDAESCAESADELTRLRDAISDCIAKH